MSYIPDGYDPNDPFHVAYEAPDFTLTTLGHRWVELHCSDRREAGALVIVDRLNLILAELKEIKARMGGAV